MPVRYLSNAIAALMPGGDAPWKRSLPTTDFYFASSMAKAIARPATIERLEPNVFLVHGRDADTLLIIRYISPTRLSALGRSTGRRIAFLLDDDIFAAEGDISLPSAYRASLRRYRDETVRVVATVADVIFAPSQLILDRFQPLPGFIIGPAMLHRFPDLSHHEELDATFDVVVNASRSHLSDIAMIASQLRWVLEHFPRIRLTTFLGKAAPRELLHPHARHLPALSWPDYRRFVEAKRFHLALAPALPTLFNAARSSSRILDNAGYGAIGLYSAREPFASWIAHGENGYLVGDDGWADVIARLAGTREALAPLARGGAMLAARLGNAQDQRDFWVSKLDFDTVQ